MELCEFNNIIQIVNRFKAVLKQKKVTQIDFAKDNLKISARLLYYVLTNNSLFDASFFKKNLVICKKIFEWTKKNDIKFFQKYYLKKHSNTFFNQHLYLS